MLSTLKLLKSKVLILSIIDKNAVKYKYSLAIFCK